MEGYEGILGTHDLIVHNYGPSHSMASIHAEVQAIMTRNTPMRSLTGSSRMHQKI